MFAQIRSELLKLATVQTSLLFGLVTAAFVGLMVAVQAATAGTEFSEPLTSDVTQTALFQSATLAPMIAIVFGCLAITSELRHHTIVSTLLFDPSRVRVVVAKAGATLVAGAALATVALLVSTVVSILILTATGTTLTVDVGNLAASGAGTILGAAIGALFGLGIGGIVRNQALAVGAVLVLMLAVEPLVASLVPDVARWLPSSLITVLTEAQSDGDIALWLAAVALAVYALVTTVGATLTLRHADIT